MPGFKKKPRPDEREAYRSERTRDAFLRIADAADDLLYYTRNAPNRLRRVIAEAGALPKGHACRFTPTDTKLLQKAIAAISEALDPS